MPQESTSAQASPSRFATDLGYASEIATIIVAVCAVLALRQLRLAKNALQLTKTDISLRTKREAVLIAAQQCERFANELIKRADVLDQLDAKGLSTDQWVLENADFDQSAVRDSAKMKAWLEEEAKSGVDTIGFLNALEAFAIYFAKGAADEQVAYSAVGPLFCDWIERLAPLLIDLRAGTHPSTTSGPYQNTVTLFQTWSGRKKKDALETSAARLKAEAAAIKDRTITPIGPDTMV